MKHKPVEKPGSRSKTATNSARAAVAEARMAKYHIELRTPDQVQETVHIEGDEMEGLRVEMTRFVGELLKDHAGTILAEKDWRVDVTNEEELILYSLESEQRNERKRFGTGQRSRR